MSAAERAIRAASSARDLCLSLERAAGRTPGARTPPGGGGASSLRARAPHRARLAWEAGDLGLVRGALGTLPGDRVATDPVLIAFRDATAA